MFKDFIGKNVKVPYYDGGVLKIARGILEEEDIIFLRINGKLGVIIINKKNVEKVSFSKRVD